MLRLKDTIGNMGETRGAAMLGAIGCIALGFILGFMAGVLL